MPSYTYRAVGGEGKPVSGILTAENYQVALRMLEEKALFPIKVTEGIEQSKLSMGRSRKVKTHHLTVFYSQLADLLRAGVPMLRALDVLSRQASQGALPQIIKELREDVAGGMGLGEGMAKHPTAFSPLHASMVRAGEQGGFLEEVLQRISIFLEKQDELRNKIRGAMIYPCILVVMGSLIVLLLMLVFVPKLRSHLRPETFNVLTHVVFWLSDVLRDHYILLMGCAVGLWMGAVTLVRTEWGRRTFERFKLRAPVLGGLLTMVALCRFCRILGTLLHNGVPILQALKVSRDSAGNEMLAKVIEQAGESVRKGAALSKPLGDSGLFPPAVVDMIAVAEESNNLESVLVQIAETNEVRTARSVEMAVKVLEPLLLVVMAVVVFCIAVALLLPILTMGSTIRGT